MSSVALVTGGTGFTGSHLVRRLIDDGWDVHVIVRPSSSLNAIQSDLDLLHIHMHDGSTSEMVSIMKKANPDIVFHLAAFIRAEHSIDDITPMVNSNLLFATQIVEAMFSCGVKRFINTGTFWEHYDNKNSSTCLYAATKHAFEAILRYYVDVKCFSAITLKLFDNYGVNDPRQKLFSFLSHAGKQKGDLMMSPGNQLLDLVYIDDVIDAYLVAAEILMHSDFQGYKFYAVSSGEPLRLRDIVTLYEEVSGTHLSIHWGGRPYRDREVMIPWNSGESLPGWHPRISIREGIQLVLDGDRNGK